MTLSPRDGEQFFEILMPFLEWVKHRDETGETLRKAQKALKANYEEVNALLRIVWNHPELITEYLDETGDEIPRTHVDILTEWKAQFLFDDYFIERFTPKGTIFISVGTGLTYLVSGLTSDIEFSLKPDALPCIVETALLPYKGKIVYDSAMTMIPLQFGKEGKRVLSDVYMTAKMKNRITKTLPGKVKVEQNENWKELVENVVLPSLLEYKDQFSAEFTEISHEEAIRQIDEQSEFSTISPDSLTRLSKLMHKFHRSGKEWDEIQEILYEGCLFTAIPPVETEKLRTVDGLLCDDGILQIFTTLEKCSEFIRWYNEETGTDLLFQLVALPFETATDIADRHGMKLFIDCLPDKLGMGIRKERFIGYDSITKRISAMFTIPG